MWMSLLFGAQAATFDPDMTWRTIQTPHFNVTFHQGLETIANEFVDEVEPIYDTMTSELDWHPRSRTEVVLVDRTDAANGYARVVPYNAIVIYVTAPQEDSSLSLYEDWSQLIMTHEFTHVLHMDTNHGIVRLARSVVGRVATTNDVSPWWMIEGLATFQETRHTRHGRGRSPFVDMIKRTSVIEDAFPPLGNLDGLQPKPPAGNLRYLFGQDFIQFVADEVDEDVWTKWTHTYGSWVPFWLPTKRVFGRSLRSLYKDWRSHLEDRYAEQLAEAERQAPFTETTRLSETEDSCGAPAYSPDGRSLVWSCYDLQEGSSIWRANGDGLEPDVLVKDRGAKNFTWRADSKAFVYAGSHTVNRFNVWSDIYLYEIGSKRTKPLTNGARARDPDFSPDGSRLITVTNQAENNQLEVSTVDGRRTKITAIDDHTQFSTPRYSPDGKVLAVSVWAAGVRDLWIYGTDGTPLRQLTFDEATDRDPVWSADGKWLFYSSDRTGIPNIFAIDVQNERSYQVTNLKTGATKPDVHPNGQTLVMQVYSNDGWEVHSMPLVPEEFLSNGDLPTEAGDPPLSSLTSIIEPPPLPTEPLPKPEAARSRHRRARNLQAEFACSRYRGFADLTPGIPAPLAFRKGCRQQSQGERIDNFDMTDVEDAFGEEQEVDWSIPPKRYNPARTLLPRFVLPFFQTTPFAPRAPFDFVPVGVQASLASSSSDMLQHFAWSALASYRTDANFVGGGAALTYNRFLPIFSVGANRSAVPFGGIAVIDPTMLDPDGNPSIVRTDERYWENRSSVFASVSYPYKPRTTVFARYSMTWRDNLFDLPEDVYLPAVPIRGRVGTLSGGWRYSWSQQAPYSISTEDGRVFSFIGSLTHPWLGSSVLGDGVDVSPDEKTGLTVAQVTTELREFIVNPLVPNHVFAMRVGGGYAIGANQFLGNYQLGGSFGDSAFVSTPDESRMLRGYAFGSDIGDRYWSTSLEYRFPIVQVQRGFGTLPVFLRNISAAGFFDAGNAFSDVEDWRGAFDGTLVGVGGEISTRWALGWGAFVTARVGYGVGLTPVPGNPRGRIGPTEPRAFYARAGGSF